MSCTEPLYHPSVDQEHPERVLPIMTEILDGKGLVKVAEGKVQVTGLKGPLEEGWEKKVASFALLIYS